MTDLFSVFPELLHLLAAAPPPSNTEPTAPAWTMFVPWILMFVLFYFMLIRPQQLKMRQHEQMLRDIETGDQVVTSGGILGTVTSKKDKDADHLAVKIADNVTVKVLRSAIQTVRKPDGRSTTVA